MHDYGRWSNITNHHTQPHMTEKLKSLGLRAYSPEMIEDELCELVSELRTETSYVQDMIYDLGRLAELVALKLKKVEQ